MEFFSKKTICGSKTNKIAANFCDRGFQTVRPRTFPTSPRIKRQKHTRRRNRADKSADMIEGWNSKHLWKHVYMQAAREAVRTVRKVLSLRTEQNSNAVTYRCVHVPAAACVEVCTRSNTNVLILSNHVVLTRGTNISQVMSSKATKAKALDTGDTHWSSVVKGLFSQRPSQTQTKWDQELHFH